MEQRALEILGQLAALSLLVAVGVGCVEDTDETKVGAGETGAGGGSGTNDHLFTQEVRVSNLPDQCTAEHVRSSSPGAGEEGLVTVARLAPPSYPFMVESIGYALMNLTKSLDGYSEAYCSSKHSHRVWVSKGTALDPGATPDVVESFDVSGGNSAEAIDWLEHQLSQPLILNEGEQLFVAVELTGTFPEVMCLARCADDTAPQANYWSLDQQAPYGWVELSAAGADGDLAVTAYGWL